MTLLPRTTISPIRSPSDRTSRPSLSTTRSPVVAGQAAVTAHHVLADPLAIGPYVAPLAVHDPELDARDRPAGERLALVAALGRLGVREDLAWLGEREDRSRLGEAIPHDRLH